MELYEREFFLSRILFGSTIIEINKDLIIYVHPPTVEQNVFAQRLFMRVYDEALLSGVYTRKEMLELMIEEGLWSEEEDALLEKNKEAIDDLKVNIYKNFLRPRVREKAREDIREIEKQQKKLYEKKHDSNYLDCQGIATLARYEWIIEQTTTYQDGTPYEFNEMDAKTVMKYHNKEQLTIKEHRELARTDPWKSIWINGRDVKKIFGRAPAEITEEQDQLVSWSRLYDNISEAHESPSDEVVEDDDAIDGWLITERRKRDKEQNKFKLDGFGDKHAGADEVYIMASSTQEAEEINNLNDERGKMIKKQRAKVIKKKAKKGKSVNYHDFNDVKLRKLNEAREQL